MLQNLTGSEAARLLAAELADYSPHGGYDTWLPNHCRRVVLELQAAWVDARYRTKQPADPRLWKLVMESAYKRAEEEHAAEVKNEFGETILLKDKIRFWRENIVEAQGLPEGQRDNLLEAQHQLQKEWRVAGKPSLKTTFCMAIWWAGGRTTW